MADFLLIGGSFASAWLVTWLGCALILLLVYPVLRKRLLSWHPAVSSRMLLLLLAVPFFLSLSTTTMLFLPVTESSLVSEHCHENCQTHMPLLDSMWLGAAGLLVVFLVACTMLGKLLFNIRTAKKLMQHLVGIGKDTGNWYQLPDSQPVVFTLGWWRNRIFVTKGLLQQCDAKDIDIILQHELAHGKRLDNLRLLLARMFLMILPARFSQGIYADLHLFTESACDFAAAEKYGELDVAETLMRVQKLVPREFSYFDNELVSAFTGAEVEQRIRNLAAGSDQFSNLQYVQSLCLIALVSLSFILVDPMHHGIEWLLQL
ncbi:MAG: M56 family metallopeptidase [Pseudohongiellaceae bacterium]